MRRMSYGVALGAAVAITVGMSAQTPQTPEAKPQRPATGNQQAAPAGATVTVEGCLMREDDALGPGPTVTERAFYERDHILTQTKMIKGAAPGAATAAAGDASDKPTGTAGTQGRMYDVEGIERERLEELVGRRVQVEGTFDNVAAATRDVRAKRGDDLVEIRGTTIRQVAGECPAPTKPGERKSQ